MMLKQRKIHRSAPTKNERDEKTPATAGTDLDGRYNGDAGTQSVVAEGPPKY